LKSTDLEITKADLEQACDDLAMMPFFPMESRASVMMLLGRMVPHRPALDWLIGECVNKLERWPGPKELRGVLCTRYDPADGVDVWCSLPGYRASDGEAQHLERHEQLKAGSYIAGEAGNYVSQLAAGLRQLASKKVQ
jgi:hypothetical protein